MLRAAPNPGILLSPLTTQEAVLSSRIEGTRASLSDILLDEMEADVPHGDEADVREVRNYVTALEHGVRRARALPLSLRLVREHDGQVDAIGLGGMAIELDVAGRVYRHRPTLRIAKAARYTPVVGGRGFRDLAMR